MRATYPQQMGRNRETFAMVRLGEGFCLRGESIPSFEKRSVYAPSVPLPSFGKETFLTLVATPRALVGCFLFCDPLALPLVPIEACAGLTLLDVVVGTGRYENNHCH